MVLCVSTNFYSSYKENERFEKVLQCLREEKAQLKEVLDLKFEKMSNNLHLIKESASIAELRIQDKVSSLHQNLSEYQVNLKSNLFQSKAESVYQISLLDGFSSTAYFGLFLLSFLSLGLIFSLTNNGLLYTFSCIKGIGLAPFFCSNNIRFPQEISVSDPLPLTIDTTLDKPFIPSESELGEIKEMIKELFN